LAGLTKQVADGGVMELKDLAGEHIFDAVDFTTEKIKQWDDCYEDATCMRFRLDGICYVALEDPSDGYRSHMEELVVDEQAVMKNCFEPIRVIGHHRTNGSWGGDDDILELIDVKNGKVILEVGTKNTSDYYPCFVSSFVPENMHVNSKD
jgi:hypothetical protein